MSRFRLVTEGSRTSIGFDDGNMNLLSADALEELAAKIALLPESTTLLIFRSERGALFAAGADMDSMRRFAARDADTFSRLGQQTFAAIASVPCATVVAIDGDCFGGALDLCLAFDLRIASPRSRFAHPGGRIGIVTGFAGTVRLPRVATRSGVAKMMLANAVLGAEEALTHGVIDAVADAFSAEESELLNWLEVLDRGTLETCRMLEEEESLDAVSASLLARRTAELHSATRN